MKKSILIFLIGFLSFPLCGQEDSKKSLLIKLVSHEGIGDELKFKKELEKIIHETDLKDEYNRVIWKHSSYHDVVDNLTEDAIVSFSPTKFALTKEKLGNAIEPLFIVHKEPSNNPYYSSHFITGVESGIISLKKDFDKIEHIYFVSPNSTSGYVYPIHELYNQGLISAPCASYLRDHDIEFSFVNDHNLVKEHVRNEKNTVGAIWNPDSTVRVFHEFEKIPQDVIFISRNLKSRYSDQIKNWFIKSREENPELYRVSSQNITGFTEYDPSKDIQYETLLKNYYETKSCEESSFKWFKENQTPILISLGVGLALLLLNPIPSWLYRKTTKFLRGDKKNQQDKLPKV